MGENWSTYGETPTPATIAPYQTAYAPWMPAMASAYQTLAQQGAGVPTYASRAIQGMVEGGSPFDTSGQFNALKQQFGLQREEDLANLFESLGGKSSSGSGYGAGKYMAQSSADLNKLMADIAMQSWEQAQGRKMQAIPYAMAEPGTQAQNLQSMMTGAALYQAPEEAAMQRAIAEYARAQYGFLPYAVQTATGGQPVTKSTSSGSSPLWGLGGDIAGAAILGMMI